MQHLVAPVSKIVLTGYDFSPMSRIAVKFNRLFTIDARELIEKRLICDYVSLV